MKKNAAKLGFMVFTVSALGVTLGHYWEDWPMAYFFVVMFSIFTAAAFDGDDK